MNPNLSHTNRWGVVDRYEDALGQWHRVSSATQAAILAAMRLGPALFTREGERPREPKLQTINSQLSTFSYKAPVLVLYEGKSRPLSKPAELILEGGSVLRVERRLPADLPPGYHDLRSLETGQATRLIVSPRGCHLPEGLQAWGWAAQLYALRSKQSWGLGDLADLRQFARWSARALRAGFLLVNPLGAATPVLPQEPSPYFPSSRRFGNPLYLRIEDVPGAIGSGWPLAKLSAAGRALNRERHIDRDGVFRLKMQALEKLWSRFRGDRSFDRFCIEQGTALRQFASFCVLAEHHGTGWRRWPARFRRPESPAVKQFCEEHSNRVRFHQWLQWLLDEQLARAAKELPLMQDLPIGFDPAGADAWVWQDVLAKDVTVGAPPDAYNTLGQDWGLPPFVPHKLRAAAYEPIRQTLRAVLRHAGGLRIDHVMGLFRLFWIPHGAKPHEGAYVRYHGEELLAIVALESQRAGAVIVGESLGTVEPGLRAQLSRRKLLSYRLLWFERRPPVQYPRQALAAVTTHDLFTLAGLWTGSDLRTQQKLGLRPNATGVVRVLRQLRAATGLTGTAPLRQAVVRTHRLLAAAPSRLLAATLDDALAVEERPNMPGTTTQWPNWSLGLPVPLETIKKSPLVRAVARALRRPSRPSPHPRIPASPPLVRRRLRASGRDSS